MHETWKAALSDELAKPYFRELYEKVKQDRTEHLVFPPRDQVLTAFKLTPLDEVRVVILGQDPYHREGQAHGLSFSVPPGVAIPPSLRNIYRELHDDLGVEPAQHGCLQAWAERGVFLLNTVLTVRAASPGSHQGWGWETFTDRVIELLGARDQPTVFILWGRHARSKAPLIDVGKHLVVESAHPSPMSAQYGFFGSRPFSQANEGLEAVGIEPVDWELPPV